MHLLFFIVDYYKHKTEYVDYQHLQNVKHKENSTLNRQYIKLKESSIVSAKSASKQINNFAHDPVHGTATYFKKTPRPTTLMDSLKVMHLLHLIK